MVGRCKAFKSPLLSQKQYMILFSIPYNHVLEGDIKKEPYGDRIPDTRFYLISCIYLDFNNRRPFNITTKVLPS